MRMQVPFTPGIRTYCTTLLFLLSAIGALLFGANSGIRDDSLGFGKTPYSLDPLSGRIPSPPTIFFTDLTSGPNTGGQNDKGAFVTLYGNNFGSSRDNSRVILSGVTLDNCPVWGASWLWYQKITCQLGASVPLGIGNIAVEVNGAKSNTLPFTVAAGHIYFVSPSGNDRNNGSFGSPWKSLLRARDNMRPGDITYAMSGVAQEGDDGNGWDSAFLLSGGAHGNSCSSTGRPRALVAYPGATSIVIGSPAGDRPSFGLRSSDCQGNWVFAGISFRGIIPLMVGIGSNYRFVGLDVTCPHSSQGGACLVTSQVEHISLYGSHVYDAGAANASAQFHGVYFSTDSNHVEMSWNLVERIRGCRGVQVHSSPLGSGGPTDPTGLNQYDVKIHDNIIHDTQCDAIIVDTVDPSKGPVVIYNNLLFNVGQGPANPEKTGAWNAINIPGNTENGAPGRGTIEIFNNTIDAYGTFSHPSYANENSAIIFNGGSSQISVHVLNNVILSVATSLFRSGVPYFIVWKPLVGPCALTDACPGMYGSKNLVFGAGQYIANAAKITDTLFTDPQLVDISAYDFRPRSGSPAIGAGLKIPGLTHDINGTPRSTPPSIGAYER